MNASFGSKDKFLTSTESTFCRLFLFFDKKIFIDLEKSALRLDNKAILNILHKIPLIGNKKLKNSRQNAL